FEAHHQIFGLVIEGNLIQLGSEPIILNITLYNMGNITFIVSFGGTSHYHASNAALQFWVIGTTEVISSIPTAIDRSSEEGFALFIKDEVSDPIPFSELDFTIELTGPQGVVILTSRLQWNQSSVDLFINSLPVGHYTLSVIVASSIERLGCDVLIDLTITSITTLEIDASFSGLIYTLHSLTFFLNDSLMEAIDGADVWLSIYDSLDREIYGHPLSTRTLLTSTILGTEVSWTPSLTGEYRILIDFIGNEFYNQSSFEIVVLVRHLSSVSLEAPELSEFGEIIPLTVTLEGAIGGMSGKTINITVFTDGVMQLEETLVTGSRGVTSYNLVGLLAGTHTIRITFEGSDSQAPCSNHLVLEITPIIVIAIDSEHSLFVDRNNTLSVSVSVLGTSTDWIGSLDAILFSPGSEELGSWNFEIDSYSILDIEFLPLVEGTYSLNVTVVGLPVTVERTYPLAIAVVRESLQIELDAGNTSLLGGFGVLSVVGLIMRKKMKGVVSSMPGEWTG
ncbi:MAG: Ig-like domain repeat protein, partial [Candidatus Thorarchaeota archaeon]|nr:Ig-like domain repeat protein [Candidatus Thorarchaeota archaeon]